MHNETRREFNEEEVETIRKFYPIGGAKKVKELLPHRSEDVIRQKASQLKISGTTNYYTQDEDNIIREHYPKHGYENVQKLLPHRNKDSIQNRAKKLGVRYLSYNKDYFEVIDTEEKAYWLGFLYADGYVTTDNRWGVELSSVDREHLEKFKSGFDCNIKLKERKRNSPFEDNDSVYESCSLMIKNSKMYKDLIDKGLSRNKTIELKFPSEDIVPSHLMNHFIRGYFDGDGSYVFQECDDSSIYKEISLVCKSENFIKELQEYLSDNDIIFAVNYSSIRELYTLRVGNSNNLIKFINYVYKDAKTYLDRKYKKAQEIKEYCLSH